MSRMHGCMHLAAGRWLAAEGPGWYIELRMYYLPPHGGCCHPHGLTSSCLACVPSCALPANRVSPCCEPCRQQWQGAKGFGELLALWVHHSVGRFLAWGQCSERDPTQAEHVEACLARTTGAWWCRLVRPTSRPPCMCPHPAALHAPCVTSYRLTMIIVMTMRPPRSSAVHRKLGGQRLQGLQLQHPHSAGGAVCADACCWPGVCQGHLWHPVGVKPFVWIGFGRVLQYAFGYQPAEERLILPLA